MKVLLLLFLSLFRCFLGILSTVLSMASEATSVIKFLDLGRSLTEDNRSLEEQRKPTVVSVWARKSNSPSIMLDSLVTLLRRTLVGFLVHR